MKTVSSKTNAGLDSYSTEPIILVSIGFSNIIYLSNSGEVEFLDNKWIPGRLPTNSLTIRTGNAGSLSGSINLINTDSFFTGLILNEGATGREISIYYLYGDPPYVESDSIEVFKGKIDGVPSMGSITTINILSEGMIQWTPKIIYSLEYFNHMKKAGTEVTIGGEKYIFGEISR